MPTVWIDAGANLGPSRDQVVEQQGLDQGQRLGAVQLRADRELPEPLGAQVTGVVHPAPDRVLEPGGEVRISLAGDPEERLVLAPGQRRAVPVGQQEGREVRVPQRVAKDQIAAPLLPAGVQPQPTNRWKPRSV